MKTDDLTGRARDRPDRRYPLGAPHLNRGARRIGAILTHGR